MNVSWYHDLIPCYLILPVISGFPQGFVPDCQSFTQSQPKYSSPEVLLLRAAFLFSVFRSAQRAASVHFLSGIIHFTRFVVAEALMLRCQQVVIEHKEVCILAGLDGALSVFDTELLSPVDRKT